ncbi:hypothetical protein BFF78_20165 [Streptomyces fodineus]|uniref:Uncharacterized protein n=1 Tax=Streptomyces fodineus TaxID=1904616 RepID=A0A1D7YCI5_9ACTN|nr:hypothetical protein [Streptomyces fodineus]AOR33069.1 hypothetical protein BFF78_20165 [Streptomyces fodineus]
MELPADNRRTALLALTVLGVLLAAVLTVFTVFDGDDGHSGAGGTAASAPASANQEQGTTGAGTGRPGAAAATPIVSLPEVVKAHAVMTRYMAGLNTYDHRSSTASWSAPLLRLTSGEPQMKQTTVLPSGKEWATCQAERCSSKGSAEVVRDAVISDDVARGSGRTISSLVTVTATRVAGGSTTTESNRWLVTVKEDGGPGGQWVVSGFNVFGLGDLGASAESGE